MSYKLAVDIGNTRCKLGMIDHNGNIVSISPSTQDIKYCGHFNNSNRFKKWLLDYCGLKPVNQIALSISGVVDHQTNMIVRSDVLGEKFDHCNMEELFAPLPIQIFNDSVATALAFLNYVKYNSSDLPCLTISLGTGIALSVVEECSSYYRIYAREDWLSSVRVATSKGNLPLNETLGRVARENVGGTRYFQRINRSINQILREYKKTYGWQPKVIFINGGGSISLNINELQGLFEPIQIGRIENDRDQNVNLLKGLFKYQQNNTEIIMYDSRIPIS